VLSVRFFLLHFRDTPSFPSGYSISFFSYHSLNDVFIVVRYGRNGEFVVICSPTDQGYFEPDTSALIRLKLATEYGYGINAASITTDKVNLLGTGAHPFWRWLEGTCRTPAGLGRVQVRKKT